MSWCSPCQRYWLTCALDGTDEYLHNLPSPDLAIDAIYAWVSSLPSVKATRGRCSQVLTETQRTWAWYPGRNTENLQVISWERGSGICQCDRYDVKEEVSPAYYCQPHASDNPTTVRCKCHNGLSWGYLFEGRYRYQCWSASNTSLYHPGINLNLSYLTILQLWVILVCWYPCVHVFGGQVWPQGTLACVKFCEFSLHIHLGSIFLHRWEQMSREWIQFQLQQWIHSGAYQQSKLDASCEESMTKE